jgi:2-polyprenyl-6-methoxyphenol hydroxylase-like FAD-dependent oxidoreductase
MDTRPILIVGAGPTGLTAAMELCRFGIPVRLVEKLTERSTTSRALAVQARTIELLAQRGPAAEMLRRGNPATGMTLHGSRSVLGHLDFGNIPSRYDYILLLSQAETEAALEQQVVKQGVTIERGTELLDYRDTGDGIVAQLRAGTGALEQLEAAFIISAEGAHSLVRKVAGLEFAGITLEQKYALGDLTIDGDLPPTDLSIFIGSRGFLAVFPLGGTRFRLVSTDPNPRSASDPSLPELQSLFDTVSHVPARLSALEWSSRFSINSRHLDTLRVGRAYLGGDSAHIHSPAGGQGMNTGIQDMINLSWKLALVHRGLADPEILDTYQSERLPIISKIVATTERSTRILNSHSRVIHAALGMAAKVALGSSRVQSTGPRGLSETAANYRGSALSAPSPQAWFSGSLRAGDRIPDLPRPVRTVAAPGVDRSLYELLDPTRMTLLLVGGDAEAVMPDLGQDVAVVRLVQPGSESTSTLGRGSSILVRPDAYAAVASDGQDLAAVRRWLGRWMTMPVRA